MIPDTAQEMICGSLATLANGCEPKPLNSSGQAHRH